MKLLTDIKYSYQHSQGKLQGITEYDLAQKVLHMTCYNYIFNIIGHFFRVVIILYSLVLLVT